MSDEFVELEIPGYRDPEIVGRGGFGVVYRAFQTDLNRTVAIKVIVVASIDDRARARFERERQSMGALSTHPAIVTVYETGVTPSGLPYLVMEFMDGGSFGDILRDQGPLPWSDAVDVGMDVAGALEAAHRAGVVHRDIKPDNVLVSGYDEVKLTDFGIASLLEGTATTSSISATIAHAAPEVLNGEKATFASDVYSLGSTIFALLVGSSAFSRGTDESVLPVITRVLTEPVPDLRPRGVPDPVCSVVERAMAKEPADRYGTAQEFSEALAVAKAAAADVGAAEIVPPVVIPITEPEPRPDTARTVISGDLDAAAAESATEAEATSHSDALAESSATSADRHGSRRPKRRTVLIAGAAVLLLLAVLGSLALLRDDGGETGPTVLGEPAESDALGATTTSTTVGSTTTTVGAALGDITGTTTSDITGEIAGPDLTTAEADAGAESPSSSTTPPVSPQPTSAPSPPSTQAASSRSTQPPPPPTTQPTSPPTTQAPPPPTTTQVVTTTTSGLVEVPGIVGQDRLAARSALQTAGFAVSEDRGCWSGGWATGQAAWQEPSAGSFGVPGSTVSFGSQFIAGCSNTTVNNVVGLTEAEAVASLTANQLAPQVTTGCFGGATPGVVVSQSPAGGSSAPQGWPITVNVQATGCS